MIINTEINYDSIIHYFKFLVDGNDLPANTFYINTDDGCIMYYKTTFPVKISDNLFEQVVCTLWGEISIIPTHEYTIEILEERMNRGIRQEVFLDPIESLKIGEGNLTEGD